MEPIILELEREENDLLIIAHESVLRVLYGYLMACNAADIPKLEFPRDEIIEIMPGSYENITDRIHIPGLPNHMLPGSPENLEMPIVSSGAETPISGLGTPAIRTPGASTPTIGTGTPRMDGVDPQANGGSPPNKDSKPLSLAQRLNVNPAK